MNGYLLTAIGLRSSALALSLSGQQRAADQLYLLADAIVAGENVDSRMAIVAAKLKQRNSTDYDWEDVEARMALHSDQLQADSPSVG